MPPKKTKTDLAYEDALRAVLPYFTVTTAADGFVVVRNGKGIVLTSALSIPEAISRAFVKFPRRQKRAFLAELSRLTGADRHVIRKTK